MSEGATFLKSSRFWMAVAIALMLVLRVYALESDAYRGLSWDTGLFTDEGFYIHNARNVALFGVAKTDGFNNMWIMPTLHMVQVAIFRVFGVGMIQARLITVVFSLLLLCVFFAALRRAFGLRVAQTGVILLGLDHVHLLYNRMALMDTPAAFVMTCALYAFVRALEDENEAERGGRAGRWALALGALLGLTYATRGLAVILIPAPFVALWRVRRNDLEKAKADRKLAQMTLFGLGIALVVFILVWYLPNRADLTRVNQYHISKQLMPHTLAQLGRNLWQAFAGERYLGLAPYLSRYTPIQFLLVLTLACGWSVLQIRPEREKRVLWALATWLALGWALFAFVNYAPSRYYALTYPAMTALAAFCLVYFSETWAKALEKPVPRAMLVALLAFYATRLALSPLKGNTLWLSGFASGVSAYCVTRRRAAMSWLRTERPLFAWLFALWAIINAAWLIHWLTHLGYTQRDADRWLAENLPAGSVLIGDCAPGLCLNNRFKTVCVIPGLCNDIAPLERESPAPRYIAILDMAWKERWWRENYPNEVDLSRRVRLFSPLISHPVGVYRVDVMPRPASSPRDHEDARSEDRSGRHVAPSP